MTDDEPRARGTILASFREAAVELWGAEGLAQIAAALPAEVRADTVDRIVVHLEWLPERYVMSWYEAVWNGPAARAAPSFARFLDRMMDRGFGRVRKLFLSLVTPATMLDKAPDLWRHDHTHGELTIEHSVGTAKVRLQDHPYTTTPLARIAIAEIYRYCLSLGRARDVTETHYTDDQGALVLTLKWRP